MIEIHPGILLICVGLLAAVVPDICRKFVLVIGPAAVFVYTFTMKTGDAWNITIMQGGILHVLEVTPENRIFLFVFALLALMGGIYAAHNKDRLEAFATMMYVGSGLGVTLAPGTIMFIFCWELMAVASMFVIWSARTPASRKAGMRYLLVHMLGGNLLLAGFFFKASEGELLIANIAGGEHDAAFWLILIGMCINAAVVPLHAWVPDAYPETTVTGGVFLSSLTTKLSVLCLVRVFAGTELLLVLGIVMALYGACFAMIENDIRRLLSYHIISQVGLMVADIGIGTKLAANAATALAFSNVLYKSLLFMCAGAVIYATGIKKINQLGGLYKKLPVVCLFFFIAAFAIAGLPGLAGFTCKSLSVHAAEEAGLELVVWLMRLASIGTALSVPYKMGYFIFFGKDRNLDVKPLSKNMYAGMGIAAGCCVLFGACPQLVYRFLPYAMEYHPYTFHHVLEYVQLLGGALLAFYLYRKKMEPHTALSLDTDWFYRKPFKIFLSGLSGLCCKVSDFFADIGRGIYYQVTAWTSRTFSDDRRAQERSRTDIGVGMIAIIIAVMAVFLVMIARWI